MASWTRDKTNVFRRKDAHPDTIDDPGHGHGHTQQPSREQSGPHDAEKGQQSNGNEKGHRFDEKGNRINHKGHRVTRGIQPDGESGRSWVNPLKMLGVCWRSSCTASKWTNVLWPFTIAALVLYFNYPEHQLWVFICSYIGMVPAANLVGFSGQELARKLPKVAGVMLETTLGSVVEVILFMVLLVQGKDRSLEDGNVPVIRAAILGSILANLLLCLGLCFFVGGIFHPQQTFHEAISEVGSNLMLVAGMALIIPAVYYNSLYDRLGQVAAQDDSTKISRATAIVLLIAFVIYVFFQARSHHGLYEDILEADEERDHDRHKDLAKEKLTFTESILAVLLSLMFVSFMAVFLVQEIEYIVEERHVKDAFVGLILIPVVEKAAEHITAIDEAYDNQMNFALSHVLGASIQTALLNTPLVVLVGWGLDVPSMNLNFELFDSVVLILAIVVVGNFLRDEKSDYLEGALCVMVYILIAVTAFFYPNPTKGRTNASAGSGEGTETASSAIEAATTAAARMLFA